MNFFNNLMGAVRTRGHRLHRRRDAFLSLAFLVAGVVLLIGIFSFVVVLGRIEPIPEPDALATRLRRREAPMSAAKTGCAVVVMGVLGERQDDRC